MAHNRPGSSGPDSSAGSSLELPPLSGLNKMGVLPEEWTLPHEWKIEKREPFANWKLDVQSQISNISTSLNKSLHDYPHPEVGDRLKSVDDATSLEWQAARRETLRSREASAVRRLGYSNGLASY